MQISPKTFGMFSIAAFVLALSQAPAASALTSVDIIRQPMGVIPLVLGIGMIVAALAIEWQDILQLIRIENESLASIERNHPRIPKKREMVIVMILSATLGIFFAEILLYMRVSSYIPSSPALIDYAAPFLPR